MIDLNEMENRQQEGATKLDSLQGEERMVMQHYCSLVAEKMLQAGSQRKMPVEKVVVNAYRFGIALGLCLKVEQGEVLGR